jgi:uncharacterized protein YbjT (DUF2867 family)
LRRCGGGRGAGDNQQGEYEQWQGNAGKGFHLRGMTRKPEGERARALSGVEIVRGDLDDAASLRAVLEGAWGVFAVQNTWEAGVEREEEQGKRLAQVAREVEVQHYVYSSVGSADRKTGIPHFDNKARIEEKVRSLEFPSWVIVRPVFFMENLVSPWFLRGDTLLSAIKPTTSLQMVAVDDVGRIGAAAFVEESLWGQAIEVAGDAATLPAAADVLSSALGRKIAFQRIDIAEVRKNSEDMAIMLEWFDAVGYKVDIAALEQRLGRMTRLVEWARRLAP